ncbi:MAG: N-6 DNA methylase [Candidatus Micrarchaeia archaeon]
MPIRVLKEREAAIHSELYRVIQNLLDKDKGFKINGVTFTKVEFKLRLKSGGEADLVLIDSNGKPWLVIETKRIEEGRYSELIDPFSTKVIKQASDYATELGAPYFATSNRDVFVLFKTFEKFVPIYETQVKDYYLVGKNLDQFAGELLRDIIDIDNHKIEWAPSHKILIRRFRTLHDLITPAIYKSLLEKIKSDHLFRERYTDWLEKEGFEFSDERNIITAKETAYLLIDKIIFYKTIQGHYDLPKLGDIHIDHLKEELDRYFDKVKREIDFIPVFERGQLFDQIPLSLEVKQLLGDFIKELVDYKFEDIGSDIMGEVYRDLIPKEEKKQFGQYYTDANICDLIVKLCIHSPNDVVLDPGCGSGTFLIKAYQYLEKLKESKEHKDPKKLHKELYEQIWGVEINQFPAHLSVMQLTMQALEAKSNDIHVIVNDFFRTHSTNIFEALAEIHSKKHIPVNTLPEVDDVVGNPPYIRQEILKEKNKIRVVALQDTDNPKEFSEKSDIYVYFFTYGLHFLKKHGKFGFITSNSWLDVKFGKGLETFFFNHCQIDYIIYFDKNVFEDALANTCITILTKKKPDLDECVKFIRIKKMMDVDHLVKLIKKINTGYEDESIRINPVKQRELKDEEKWSFFIRAPPIYKQLRKHQKLAPLSDQKLPSNQRIAEVKRCITTQANDFFILSKSKAKEWGIESDYLTPVISSPKDVSSLQVKKSKLKNYLLIANLPKSKLRGKNILHYIDMGEKKKLILRKNTGEVVGYQNTPSLKNKKIWYSIPKQKPAPILWPLMFWDNYPILLNDDAQATHNFYSITPRNKDDLILLLAYLNSSLTGLFIELFGRIPGGRLVELMVYEVAELPVLDPSKLTQHERNKLENTFHTLLEVQEKGQDETSARAKLDEVVFDILELTHTERTQVLDGLKELKRIRQEGLVRVKPAEIESSGKKKKPVKEKYIVKPLHHWIEEPAPSS